LYFDPDPIWYCKNQLINRENWNHFIFHRHLFLSMGGPFLPLTLKVRSKREEGPPIDRNKCLWDWHWSEIQDIVLTENKMISVFSVYKKHSTLELYTEKKYNKKIKYTLLLLYCNQNLHMTFTTNYVKWLNTSCNSIIFIFILFLQVFFGRKWQKAELQITSSDKM
jgi:hypothetical protein